MASGMLIPLIPMIIPMIAIGIAIALFGEILFNLLKFVPYFLKLALKIFNPDIFIRDLLFGIIMAVTMIAGAITDNIKMLITTIFRSIFGNETGGLFGQGKQKDPKTGKYYYPSQVKCKKPPKIIHYIILILCPPFYIFLKKGLNGWIYILIDILLTLIFYFPGLVFALIVAPICF